MMGLKIERIPAPVWVRPFIPVLGVLITFLLTAVLVVMVDANPITAYYYFLVDPLSSQVSAIEVLVKSTPLLLTGAAVTFAFIGGFWNIGAEGQLYAGATAATAIGIQMHGAVGSHPADAGRWLYCRHGVGANSGADEGQAGHR